MQHAAHNMHQDRATRLGRDLQFHRELPTVDARFGLLVELDARNAEPYALKNRGPKPAIGKKTAAIVFNHETASRVPIKHEPVCSLDLRLSKLDVDRGLALLIAALEITAPFQRSVEGAVSPAPTKSVRVGGTA
jgi:hypothetical protein